MNTFVLMKTLCKITLKIGFASVLFAMSSCTSSTEANEDKSELENVTIAKKWVLTDKVHDKDKTSKVIFSLEPNGYFMVYDSITDPKMIAAGIGRILPISRGQWKTEGDKLIITHMSVDTIRPETLTIKKIESKELILLDNKNKAHKYISR